MKIETEEKRINEETTAVQRDLEAKRAHLELEATKLESALDRARDIFSAESAAAASVHFRSYDCADGIGERRGGTVGQQSEVTIGEEHG